nr:unnamed protein product [Callosobruchus analis]
MKLDVATQGRIIFTTRHYHQKLKKVAQVSSHEVSRTTKAYAIQLINEAWLPFRQNANLSKPRDLK